VVGAYCLDVERPVEVAVVLFDLGGVIVDLSGLDRFLQRHRIDKANFWPRWLGDGRLADFERGESTPAEFASAFVEDFGLSISPDEFLVEFAAWPCGLLPGAADLLERTNVPTATVSNTNVIHWGSAFTQGVLLEMFDAHFPSFELKMAKPDPAIFEHVVAQLGVPARSALFVDDNEINVVAARAVGLNAFLVDGPGAAGDVLRELGVLAPI
jgi:glucose-1-phosphatase